MGGVMQKGVASQCALFEKMRFKVSATAGKKRTFNHFGKKKDMIIG
jgi:hypothetical protein